MIKIRITWPLLILLMLALLVWLIRGQAPKPAKRRTPSPRPSRPRPTRGTVIIDQDGSSTVHDRDYDAETERLDREAAEAGYRATARRPRAINPLRTREACRDRAAAH